MDRWSTQGLAWWEEDGRESAGGESTLVVPKPDTVAEELFIMSQHTRDVNTEKFLAYVVYVTAKKLQLPKGDEKELGAKLNRSLEVIVLSTNPDRQSYVKPSSSDSSIKKVLVAKQGGSSNLSPQENKPVIQYR